MTQITTIATNTSEMACDLQGTMNGDTKLKMHTKIYKFDPHEMHYPESEFIVGFSGTADQIIECVDYFSNPEAWGKPPRVPGLAGLVLTASGLIYSWATPGKWVRIKAPFMAIGSGQHMALGAFHAGATPKQAVLAASKVDPFTGMGTKTLKF